MTKLLTAADILACEDLPRALVALPLWKGSVWVRALTLREQDEIRAKAASQMTVVGNQKTGLFEVKEGASRIREIRAYTVALGAIDESGNRLFSDDQVSALDQKSAAMVDLLFAKITELSSMTPEEISELEGESEAVPSGDSSTD